MLARRPTCSTRPRLNVLAIRDRRGHNGSLAVSIGEVLHEAMAAISAARPAAAGMAWKPAWPTSIPLRRSGTAN